MHAGPHREYWRRPLAANVVFGRIQLVHVSDEVLGPDGGLIRPNST